MTELLKLSLRRVCWKKESEERQVEKGRLRNCGNDKEFD